MITKTELENAIKTGKLVFHKVGDDIRLLVDINSLVEYSMEERKVINNKIMGKEIIVVENPKSPEAEMFRNLRTNIQFMNADSEKKVMVVTSTIPGEGKSYVSANLAAAFAQLDKKVLIIDTDMRKSVLIGRLRAKVKGTELFGLSHYLSGQKKLEDVF